MFRANANAAAFAVNEAHVPALNKAHVLRLSNIVLTWSEHGHNTAKKTTDLCFLIVSRGFSALLPKGYHAFPKIHVNRVVFKDNSNYMRNVNRVSNTPY